MNRLRPPPLTKRLTMCARQDLVFRSWSKRCSDPVKRTQRDPFIKPGAFRSSLSFFSSSWLSLKVRLTLRRSVCVSALALLTHSLSLSRLVPSAQLKRLRRQPAHDFRLHLGWSGSHRFGHSWNLCVETFPHVVCHWLFFGDFGSLGQSKPHAVWCLS